MNIKSLKEKLDFIEDGLHYLSGIKKSIESEKLSLKKFEEDFSDMKTLIPSTDMNINFLRWHPYLTGKMSHLEMINGLYETYDSIFHQVGSLIKELKFELKDFE